MIRYGRTIKSIPARVKMLNTANYRHILLLELEQSLRAPGRPLKPRRKKKTIVSGYRKQQLDVCSPPSCICRSSIVFHSAVRECECLRLTWVRSYPQLISETRIQPWWISALRTQLQTRRSSFPSLVIFNPSLSSSLSAVSWSPLTATRLLSALLISDSWTGLYQSISHNDTHLRRGVLIMTSNCL